MYPIAISSFNTFFPAFQTLFVSQKMIPNLAFRLSFLPKILSFKNFAVLCYKTWIYNLLYIDPFVWIMKTWINYKSLKLILPSLFRSSVLCTKDLLYHQSRSKYWLINLHILIFNLNSVSTPSPGLFRPSAHHHTTSFYAVDVQRKDKCSLNILNSMRPETTVYSSW